MQIDGCFLKEFKLYLVTLDDGRNSRLKLVAGDGLTYDLETIIRDILRKVKHETRSDTEESD